MRIRVVALVALEILLVIGLASGEFAMVPAARDTAVEPADGNWDGSYDYSVELLINDTVSIELWVWDPLIADYIFRGTAEYKDIGNWTRIYWHVSPFSGSADYAGHNSRFKFRWNGTDIKESEDGALRPLIGKGPSIKSITIPSLPPTVEIFKNAMVKPAYGHYNDSFTYSVFAQLNQTRNITMEVFDISSYVWKTVGEAYYSDRGNWQLLSWADVTNVPAFDSAGVSSYRFFFIDAGARRESVVFYGPELGLYPTPAPAPVVIRSGGGGISRGGLLEDEVLQKELADKLRPLIVPGGGGGVEIEPPERISLINDMVTPARGSWDASYNYSVVVEHPNRADMWLTLVVYCPGQMKNYTISSQAIWDYNETTNRATVEWRGVNVFREEDAKAKANESQRYYIHYNDGWNKDFKGFSGPVLSEPYSTPDSIVPGGVGGVEIKPPKLINATVTHKRGSWNENYNYSVVVVDPNRAERRLTLEVYCPGKGITYIISKQKVNSSEYDESNRKTIEWLNVTVFSKEDARANETPRFYIYFIGGHNNDILEKSYPKLNYPPLLSPPTVSPGNGTVGDSFEYEVNVIDKDADNNVTVTLYIVDPEGGKKEGNKTEVNATAARNGTTALCRYKFTKKDDAGKTFGYYFSANDTKDVEKVEGEGPSITDGIDETEKVGGEGPRINQIILGGLGVGFFLIILIIAVVIIIFKNTKKELLKNIEEKVKGTAESLEKKKEINFRGRCIEEEID